MRKYLISFLAISFLVSDLSEGEILTSYLKDLKKEMNELPYDQKEMKVTENYGRMVKLVNEYLEVTLSTTEKGEELYDLNCSHEGVEDWAMEREKTVSEGKPLEKIGSEDGGKKSKVKRDVKKDTVILTWTELLPNYQKLEVFIGSQSLDYKSAKKYCLSEKGAPFMPKTREDYDNIMGIVSKLTFGADPGSIWYPERGQDYIDGMNDTSNEKQLLLSNCYLIVKNDSPNGLKPTSCDEKALPLCIKLINYKDQE